MFKRKDTTASQIHLPALILGNGPSASQINFADSLPFDCFGMNSAYRHWHEVNWYPDYYSCLDTVVGMSHSDAISNLVENATSFGIKRFLLRANLVEALDGINGFELIDNFDVLRQCSSQLMVGPVTTGSHTLAWATYLGYQKVVTIGVDCNYVEMIDEAESVDANTLKISAEPAKNPNYFFDSYQRKGDSYQVPNPSKDLHIQSWRNVASKLPPSIDVVNANPHSKMDAFDFCSWDEALNLSDRTTFNDRLIGLVRRISRGQRRL